MMEEGESRREYRKYKLPYINSLLINNYNAQIYKSDVRGSTILRIDIFLRLNLVLHSSNLFNVINFIYFPDFLGQYNS